MKPTLILNAKIINEGKSFRGSVLIKDEKIEKIFREDVPEKLVSESETIDAEGLWLIPGIIDEHVHFRQPGLTDKADIAGESRAAAAGGVTTFFDMPNCIPQTTTLGLLEEKCDIAAQNSLVNYSFYLGATSGNLDEIKCIDPKKICGVKLFMGASTGNMSIDGEKSIAQVFAESPVLVATHNEDNQIIRRNIEKYKAELGDDIPVEYHTLIRSEDACFRSSAKAVELAQKYGTRLHILHVSTAKELSLFDAQKPVSEKQISAETCPQYLRFCADDYAALGTKIKCNPAVKSAKDRDALAAALQNDLIDCIGSDHAPHRREEKAGNALTALSGMPTMQFSLNVLFDLVKKGLLTREKMVEKLCHNPATAYKISKRGFVRKGYFADLVLIAPNATTAVGADTILSKCGWSPLEGATLGAKVTHTFVNGKLVFAGGKIVGEPRGQRVLFDR